MQTLPSHCRHRRRPRFLRESTLVPPTPTRTLVPSCAVAACTARCFRCEVSHLGARESAESSCSPESITASTRLASVVGIRVSRIATGRGATVSSIVCFLRVERVLTACQGIDETRLVRLYCEGERLERHGRRRCGGRADGRWLGDDW